VAVDALLSDGSTVHIRQITPEDADRIVALHARFSERTRYLRYFSPYPRIPPRDLARFVTVDHHDREALVVAVGDNLIAVGRYERLGPSSADAEVAFVVEDTFQGKGIGPLLLEHLAEAARAVGITRFVAEVLPQNRPMMRVLFDAGYQVSRQWDEGVVHLTFPIEPTTSSEQVQRSREAHPEAASIARLLTPSSVLVYGVRHDGTGVGASLLRHIRTGGYTGSVGVVHPSTKDGTVASAAGVAAFPSAGAAGPVDLAVVAVPWDGVPTAVADAGAAGAHGAVVVSGGFAEVRASGVAAQRDLVAVARTHGMRLVGPNCLGVLNTDPAVSLNATLVPAMPVRGRVGLFCQSGFVGVAMLTEVIERNLGLSTFVSAGNRADVSGNDLLQYWREDPHTDVVLLYLETFGNPHKFARIARELGRDKPVAVVAAGAAAGSGPAGLAWSGARGPEEEAVAALVAHSGVIRVETVPELLDVGQILAACPLPAGSRVGVVGNDAALVQLAAAECTQAGLPVTHSRWAAPGQPIRVLRGLASSAAQRDDVDIVLAVVAPKLPGSPVDDAVEPPGSEDPDKPVVVVTVGSPSQVERARPRFRTVEEAVRALAHVVRYAQWRRTPLGSPPSLSSVDSAAARSLVASAGRCRRC